MSQIPTAKSAPRNFDYIRIACNIHDINLTISIRLKLQPLYEPNAGKFTKFKRNLVRVKLTLFTIMPNVHNLQL
jgi:hypothetical protein